MAENTMKLEVITPERSFYTGDVTFVELIQPKEKSESTQDTSR